MRYIVVGSRKGANYRILREYLNKVEDIECIISGGARGVDTHARIYAQRNHIDYEEYLPDWENLGKKAGYLRNRQMAENGEAVILFWNGESKGSQHWFSLAKEFNLDLEVVDL